MNRFEIENFARSAIVIIIKDILEIDIVIPNIVFDYSINPDIRNGYYMCKNLSGNIIILNMKLIEQLRVENDIKTVITYGFIHEIIHMFQYIDSKYSTNSEYHNLIEDKADYETINFIMNNKELIELRLKFKINEVFLNGIKRQLKILKPDLELVYNTYTNNTIAGALCSKLNLNYDYIRNLLGQNERLKITFPDKREYFIDLNYATSEEVNLLINLIYLTDIKFIYIKQEDGAYPFLLNLELY